jgi:hypothetical protein
MTWDMIIGIDCATAPEKTGLALARPAADGWRLEAAQSGRDVAPAEQLLEWLSGTERPLLCLDAPLGWPLAMGQLLEGHRAGEGMTADADRLFHRQCDDFIQARTGCRPMEVGANFIARTALSALKLLAEVRERSDRRLPLLWHHEAGDDGGVIEVYPAATLRMHGLPWRRYKPAAALDLRDSLIEGWSAQLIPPAEHSPARQAMRAQADVLDAAHCVLAGVDFIHGQAMPPPRLSDDLAVEGWIWTRRAEE